MHVYITQDPLPEGDFLFLDDTNLSASHNILLKPNLLMLLYLVSKYMVKMKSPFSHVFWGPAHKQESLCLPHW